MKNFNVTGPCVPKKHYMVDISGKLKEIKKLVDNGSYFTINKARQYGKTTTLFELRKTLQNEYDVYFVSFEGVGEEEISFDTEFESIEKNPINFIELRTEPHLKPD